EGWEMVDVYGVRPYRSALMRRVATPTPEEIPPALVSPADYDRCFQPDLTLQKVAGNRAWLGLNQASGMDARHLAVLVETGTGLALFGRTFLSDNDATAVYGEVFGRTRTMPGVTSVMGQFVPDDVVLNVVAALCGTFDVNGIG